MDTLTSTQRSTRMARVRSKDTKPEMLVRRLVHGLGYRYRLHTRDIPGRPDLAFKGKRKLIFVHGCFWHQHPDPACKLARMPKSRQEFWGPKLDGNRVRDAATLGRLEEAGWDVLTVWECQLRDREALAGRLVGFLGDRCAH